MAKRIENKVKRQTEEGEFENACMRLELNESGEMTSGF